MKLALRSRAAVLALFMAWVLGLTPAALWAAPQAQAAEPVIIGYYQSDVMSAASGPGLQISLTLYDDGSAEVISDYLNDEPPIVEVGTWEQNADGSVTLVVTGTDSEAYGEPIELTFELGDDGSLSIPGVEGGAFGAEGLSLAPAEPPAAAGAPGAAITTTAELAPAGEITATAGVTPGAEVTATGTLTAAGEITAPAALTATGAVTATGTVTETQPDQEVDVYLSDLLPVATGAGRQVTLTVSVDGSVEMVTDLMNGEPPLVETGEWARSSGVLTVTLTAGAEGEYDEPVVYAFQEQDDGSLLLPGEEGGPFGSDGLVLLPTEEPSEVDASGVYASDVLPAAGAPGMLILAILYGDGDAQVSSYYLNGEPPIVEVGSWAANADATITITATGTLDQDYETPTSATFEVSDAGLVAGSVTLRRLPAAGTAAEAGGAPAPVARYQTEVMPAASSPGLQIALTLYDGNSAEMSSDYMNDEAPFVDLGTWAEGADNTLALTLTGNADGPYDPPVEMVFERQDDGSLVAVDYPQEIFGEAGLTLLPLSAEESGDEAAGSTQGGEGEPTAEPTGEPEADSGVRIGGGMVFQSALPAASGSGREITLSLLEDGSAIMSTDYRNDQPPVTEFGDWVRNADGSLTLTLTEGPSGAYAEPIEITFAVNADGSLTATDYDTAIFGDAGLELTPVSGG